MSLLDAVRLIQDGLDNDVSPCPVCTVEFPDEHHPRCATRMLPTIVKAIEAAGALLEAVQRIRGHTRRDIDVHGKPSKTVAVCSGCDDVWPCDGSKLEEPADALWKLLDPDAYRENELYHAYLDYLHEQHEQGKPDHVQPQLPGESRTAWFTRLLTAVGRMPA